MAVYTPVSEIEAKHFLKDYALGELCALWPITAGVENSNFRLETETGFYILTLYEKRVKAEDLPFFISLMQHLADKHVPCPLPIAAKDGQPLRELCGRPTAIVSCLKGREADIITVDLCQAVGKQLAHLHLAGEDFPLHRKNNLQLEGWEELYQKCASRADEFEPEMAQFIRSELDFLQSVWPQQAQLPCGIIHADMFPDNVLLDTNIWPECFAAEIFSGKRLPEDGRQTATKRQENISALPFNPASSGLGLIDFYFACTDFWAYDLAITLNAWCGNKNEIFSPELAAAMLAGYSSVRPLSEAEKSALPILLRGAAMRFMLTRLYDWLNRVPGALVNVKNPGEYLSRLKFHQQSGQVFHQCADVASTAR